MEYLLVPITGSISKPSLGSPINWSLVQIRTQCSGEIARNVILPALSVIERYKTNSDLPVEGFHCYLRFQRNRLTLRG